jgi:hypothetical protein
METIGHEEELANRTHHVKVPSTGSYVRFIFSVAPMVVDRRAGGAVGILALRPALAMLSEVDTPPELHSRQVQHPQQRQIVQQFLGQVDHRMTEAHQCLDKFSQLRVVK